MTTPQIVAIIVFVITFAMILSDRVDRTIVAMVGAAVMVAGGHADGLLHSGGGLVRHRLQHPGFAPGDNDHCHAIAAHRLLRVRGHSSREAVAR